MNKNFLYTAKHFQEMLKLANEGNPLAQKMLEENAKLPTVLEEAENIIYGDREQLYGDPSKNLARIAELWERYLLKNVRNKLPGYISISITDVCHMMQLLKWARDETVPKRDNVVDDLGYGALVYRCREAANQDGEAAGPIPNYAKEATPNFHPPETVRPDRNSSNSKRKSKRK